MKRTKNLFPQIIEFSNLHLAAQKAQKGKRFQENVSKFNFDLEKNLFQLQQELKDKTYQPGNYREFYIYEPKPRMISAAPYRDRVIHHALCNVVAPILEKSLIYDTYANRKGKGTHKAILRYQSFCKRKKYVLKCDVRKYFPSIDHAILKEKIRRKIGCKDTLWLIDKIIDNSNPQEEHEVVFQEDDLFSITRRKGLPIGNLTSQLFGNFYLSDLDHFIKEKLFCKYYVRYVDDFVILADDKKHLLEIKQTIISFLEKDRLIFHPQKSRVFQVNEGIAFLGHRVFPDFRLVNKENVRRFRKRLKWMLKKYYKGELAVIDFNQRIRCWFGHLSFSNTWKLREKIFIQIYRK